MAETQEEAVSILTSIIDAVLNLIEGRPLSDAEMADALDKKAAVSGETLDWRNSIVDLMKTVGMDSSLANREKLAAELGYGGPYNGSAEMNMWLHQKVMDQLRQSLS